MGSKSKTQRRQNKGPFTPATPRGCTPNTSETSTQDSQPATGAQDSRLPISPFATPPTSPSSPSINLPPLMSPPLEPTISADDIISKDIVAIADMFATMKKAMLIMTSAFDRFEIQTEKFASLSLDIKAAEQVCPYPIVITVLYRSILYYII
jgi:hypothetical protein